VQDDFLLTHWYGLAPIPRGIAPHSGL